MQLFILRTDIENKQKADLVGKVFNNDANIIDWSVDIEDIDNVLRVETTDAVTESEIIDKVKAQGFDCADLEC